MTSAPNPDNPGKRTNRTMRDATSGEFSRKSSLIPIQVVRSYVELLLLTPLLLFILTLTGCASGSSSSRSENPEKSVDVADSSTTHQLRPVSSQIASLPIESFLLNGALLRMRGQWAEAVEYYRGVLSVDPVNIAALDGMARSFDRLELPDSAISYAQRSVALGDSSMDGLRFLAERLVGLGRYQEAVPYFRAIASHDPDDLEAEYMIARIIDRESPNEAAGHYQYIVDNISEDYLSLAALYEIHAMGRKFRLAARTAGRLLRHEPQNPKLHQMYCNAWINCGEYDSAIDALQFGLVLMEEDHVRRDFYESELQLTDLQLRAGAGDPDGFRRFARELVAGLLAQPSLSPRIDMSAGNIALRLGDDAMADSLIDRGTSTGWFSAHVWIETADLYLLRSRPEGLLQHLSGWGMRGPESADVEHYLGRAWFLLGKEDSAITHFQRGVALNPGLGEAWKHIAWIYADRSEVPRAVDAFERGVEAAPYDAPLLDSYAAFLIRHHTQLDRAATVIGWAIDIAPQNGEYLTTRSRLAFVRGDYSGAETYLRRGIELAGESSGRLELLGDIRMASGDTVEARNLWNRSLTLVRRDSQPSAKPDEIGTSGDGQTESEDQSERIERLLLKIGQIES